MALRSLDVSNALRAAAELTSGLLDDEPIDVFALARELGVKSVQAREMIAEGYLGSSPSGDLVIRYRADRNRVRTRFTIAHELGHILLARAQGKEISGEEFRAESGTTDEEIAVNRIAAEILMPEGSVRRFLASGNVSWRRIDQFCSRFNVSVSAALRRLLEIPGVPAIWVAVPVNADWQANPPVWSLRASQNPRLLFSQRTSLIVRTIFESAVHSRVGEINVFVPERGLILHVVSRLFRRLSVPTYWCVSWSIEPS